MELLGFVGEGLHEAGVPYFAHEEVVEVAGRVLGVELERARSGSSTSVKNPALPGGAFSDQP